MDELLDAIREELMLVRANGVTAETVADWAKTLESLAFLASNQATELCEEEADARG